MLGYDRLPRCGGKEVMDDDDTAGIHMIGQVFTRAQHLQYSNPHAGALICMIVIYISIKRMRLVLCST